MPAPPTEQVDVQALLEVVDDGIGIPEAEWENVFRDFYRLGSQGHEVHGSGRADPGISRGAPATEAGTPNAIPAGYLHTSGDRILDTQNRPVRILGVNWFGLDCRLPVERPPAPGSHGVLMAMGPGFCSELVLLRAPEVAG